MIKIDESHIVFPVINLFILIPNIRRNISIIMKLLRYYIINRLDEICIEMPLRMIQIRVHLATKMKKHIMRRDNNRLKRKVFKLFHSLIIPL